MSSDNAGYIMVLNPNNPNQVTRAKLLNYEKVSGKDHEFRLPDGTRIQLILDVDTISRILDPETNRPSVNPKTGEPMYNISWGVRVRTIYSEEALNQSRGENSK